MDHISGVTTDNRRQNLRAVTPRGNHLNRKNNQDVIGVQPIGQGYTAQFSICGHSYKLPLLSSRIHCSFLYDTICTFLGEEAPNGITLTDREQARLGELLWATSRRHTRNLVSQRLLDGLIHYFIFRRTENAQNIIFLIKKPELHLRKHTQKSLPGADPRV